MTSPWTEERVARLSELWKQGVAAQLIGVDIGLTKNAVIGKAHRLELPGRGSPIDYSGRSPEKKALRQAAFEQPKRLTPLGGGKMPTGRSVVQTHRMVAGGRMFRACQWIEGEKGVDFEFYADAPRCPAVVQGKSSYCPEHEARVWRPVRSEGAA